MFSSALLATKLTLCDIGERRQFSISLTTFLLLECTKDSKPLVYVCSKLNCDGKDNPLDVLSVLK